MLASCLSFGSFFGRIHSPLPLRYSLCVGDYLCGSLMLKYHEKSSIVRVVDMEPLLLQCES